MTLQEAYSKLTQIKDELDMNKWRKQRIKELEQLRGHNEI